MTTNQPIMLKLWTHTCTVWVSRAAPNKQVREACGHAVYLQAFAAAEFNFTGPPAVMLAASNIFRVDMYLPTPASDVLFEAFSPTNFTDAMTVCSVAVVAVGTNFGCMQYEKIPYTLYPSASGLTNEYGRLETGPLSNAG